jgi:hypothetical protein
MELKKPFDINPIYDAAWDVQSFCLSRGWSLCFIGGVAVQRWGEPRFTQDADLTLLTGVGDEDRFIKPLVEKFETRRSDAAAFARHNRVLLLRADNGIPLDIAFGALEFEQQAIARSSRFAIDGSRYLITCSAEDLIVHKAFASRAGDWQDVERILMRQRGKLDLALVWHELRPLIELKEAPEIETQLKQLIVKVDHMKPSP